MLLYFDTFCCLKRNVHLQKVVIILFVSKFKSKMKFLKSTSKKEKVRHTTSNDISVIS